MNATFSTSDQIKVLAGLMRTHRKGEPCRTVFFLGAGAPRAAGLPLADELKLQVAKNVFGTKIPPEIAQGRLEDVMELFYEMGGENGYELVAEEIRRYRKPPRSYLLLADLVRENYVEAVLTTNFDLLLDEISSIVQVNLTVMASNEDFENKKIPHDSTLLGKLHGSASDSSTMRGSWTDVRKDLPKAKDTVLKNLVGNFLAVFVGYSACDLDIRKALQKTPKQPPRHRIFWVDPRTSPKISKVLGWFGSTKNHFNTTAEDFFQVLHDELFGSDRSNSHVSAIRKVVDRIQRSCHVSDFQARQTAKEQRESYRHRVDKCVWAFLEDMKHQYAPDNNNWLVCGKAFNIDGIQRGECADAVEHLSRGMTDRASLALQIRTGGPGLTMFIGNHYAGDGHEIFLTALVAYHRKSKPKTGTPLPPLQVWDCDEYTVEWGSEASFREMETWLQEKVRPLFSRNIKRFGEAVDGRT